MNMHIVRSLQTQYEVQKLCAVPTQIVSPQASRPVMGLVQDSLLGMYRITNDQRPDYHPVNLMELMRIVGWTNTYTGRLLPSTGKDESGNQVWDGTALVSGYFPKISYKFEDEKNNLQIQDGRLLPGGYFTKVSFGAKAGSVIHLTWNDYGHEATRHLFDNTTATSMQWLLIDGFSVGLKDTYIPPKNHQEISKKVNQKVIEAKLKIDFLHRGWYPILGDDLQSRFNNQLKLALGVDELPEDPERFLDTGKSVEEQFEIDIYSVLNTARGIAEKETYRVLKEVADDEERSNRMSSMVESGSKGSKTNLVQIISLLGQQGIEGSRAPEDLYRRTLPHFSKDDISPEARGFIDNSYLKGLTPLQYIPHSQAGRIGVISTSIKTAETGYLQRRLMKIKEDAQVRFDGTVRNANDMIIEYSYGGDGFDGCKIEPQKFDYLDMSNNKFQRLYSYMPDEDLETLLSKEAYDETIETEGWKLILDEEFAKIAKDREYLKSLWGAQIPSKIYSPVNFKRMIKNYQYRFHLLKRSVADISPIYIIEKVQELVKEIVEDVQILHGEKDFAILFSLIRSHLSSKKLIKEKYDKESFNFLLEEIRKHYYQAAITPGEMVGAIAAQSIGEPSTQLCHHKNERVLVIIEGKNVPVYTGKIGKFIDKLMDENKEKVVEVTQNCCGVEGKGSCTQVLDLKETYWVASITKTEKIEWHKLTQVSRHHAHGDLVRVTTKSGRETTATKSHSFFIRTEDSIAPIKGGNLRLGDRIPVVKNLPRPPVKKGLIFKDTEYKSTRKLAFNCGKYCRGTYAFKDKNKFYKTVTNDGRKVPDFLWTAGNKIIKKFLQGLGYNSKSTLYDLVPMIGNSHLEELFAEDILMLLGRIGKFRSIDAFDTGNASKLDKIPELQGLIGESDIPRKKLKKLLKNNNYDNKTKSILEQAVNSDVVWDEIVKLETVADDGEYVYDFTVPGTESFMLMSGIIAHNTLDVFHSTGVGSGANVSRGVPRLKEILRVAQTLSTPALEVHLNQDYLKGGLDLNKLDESKQKAYNRAEEAAARMEYTVLRDLVNNVQIMFDANECASKMVEDQAFINAYYEFMPKDECLPNTSSPWLLRIQFREDVMYKKGITMLDIETALRVNNDKFKGLANLRCIFSDDNSEQLVCRVRIEEGILTNQNPVNVMRLLEKLILDLKIVGIDGIETARVGLIEPYLVVEPDGTIGQSFNYVVHTSGVNLIEVFNEPQVDYTKTLSNHIIEVLEVLGIEAVREMVIKEIMDVLTFAGSYINPRHVELLADIMTREGYLISVDRHGINKGDSGPWARASFEETTNQLFGAALYGETDPMSGVSANIMFGQPFKGGTNSFNIAIDEAMLINVPSAVTKKYQDESEPPKVTESKDYCSIDQEDHFTFQL